MIERIETGSRSSKIVKHNGVAYITGQVGEGENIQAQTTECLRRLDALLIQAGSSREKMLRATIWLADMSDSVGNIFEILGFHRVYRIFPSEADAIDSFRQGTDA